MAVTSVVEFWSNSADTIQSSGGGDSAGPFHMWLIVERNTRKVVVLLIGRSFSETASIGETYAFSLFELSMFWVFLCRNNLTQRHFC
jgi:hypothetical protein